MVYSENKNISNFFSDKMCLQKIFRKRNAYVGHILSRTLFSFRLNLFCRNQNGEICQKSTVIFRSWCDLGVFEKILQSLVETGRKFFLVEIDSTFCKVHQHAAGARKIFGNDKQLYKSRNIIERFFQRIKNYRHVTTRYDKLSVCFLNFVFLAAVMIQI